MIYADTAVKQERTRFVKKWQMRCPAVVESLKEERDQAFSDFAAHLLCAGPTGEGEGR